MTSDDPVQCKGQGISTQAARELHRQGNVIEGVAGFELVKEPEALLCKRKWDGMVGADRYDRCGSRRSVFLLCCGYLVCQCGDGG